MKRYRVIYRASDQAPASSLKTEDVYADGWRVDSDKVVLFQHLQDADTPVFDVPKSRIMRIQEMGQ